MTSKSASSPLSALLSFTAENVRSYRDEVHLSLLGTRLAEPGAARSLSLIGSAKQIPVLPAAGLFGANASGKTALLEAIDDMSAIVLGSFRMARAGSQIFRCPFGLDDESSHRPSRFEVELIIDGVRWQYGFTIDDYRVLDEYAYHYPRGRQARVFHREGASVEFGQPFRSEGKVLLRPLHDNVLLSSVAGAFGTEGIAQLYEWFETKLQIASSRNRALRADLTAGLAESAESKARILSLLRFADLGVTDIHREEPPPEVLERLRRIERAVDGPDRDEGSDEQFSLPSLIHLTHSAADGDARIPPHDESLGTQVWLALTGPILQTLDAGAVLLVDELDASLHPWLVQKILLLFQDERTNPRCAQLVFNSHDTSILGDTEWRVLGRDQVWFTEKSEDGATSLYPLSDFSPRKDDAIERRYLQGRYGAVPSFNPAEIEQAFATADI